MILKPSLNKEKENYHMIKRKIAKQNSKNKSKDEENIHLFQNKVLIMDEGHLELKLAIKIRMSIQTWTKICS